MACAVRGVKISSPLRYRIARNPEGRDGGTGPGMASLKVVLHVLFAILDLKMPSLRHTCVSRAKASHTLNDIVRNEPDRTKFHKDLSILTVNNRLFKFLFF